MKKQPDDPATDKRALDHAARALAEAGDLMPTSEELVAQEQASQADVDFELPESLRSFQPRATAPQPKESTRNVVDITQARQARTGWLNYAAASLLGAAAASLLFVTLQQPAEQPVSIGPSGETTRRAIEPDPPAQDILLSAARCGDSCCAGMACAKASQQLAACPSGRTCISCNGPDASERYRLRIGTLALSEAGLKVRDAGKWQKLEVCMTVGSSDFSCVPAHAGSDTATTWTSLPLVASVQDGLAGFELQVRAQGQAEAVAAWRGPVAVNPTVLCKGLSLQPKVGQDVFGTVSLFLDDTHFVELERSARVRPLEDYRRRFRGRVRPKVFQVEAEQPSFALSIGPTTHAEAEQLRWQLLELGAKARLSLGLDYEGARP